MNAAVFLSTALVFPEKRLVMVNVKKNILSKFNYVTMLESHIKQL